MQFMRTSSLVLTTTLVTVAAMLAVQFLDYEYSKIFAQAYPEPAALTAFLGLLDGLTTLGALVLQWFVTPWCLRRLRVQGTNLLFPYLLTLAFGGLLVAPSVVTAMTARCIRMGCMPSLRGTTTTLILNAVPRRMGARVRNFNTGVAVPIGLWLGALFLVLLQEVAVSVLFPALGVLVSLAFVYFVYRQNRAYDEALVGLLRENQIHLLDLHADDLRPLDGTAVAAISQRLEREQSHLLQQHAVPVEGREPERQEIPRIHEEASLAAIALLRTIGSPDACAVLQQHLPLATPRLTAAALQALAVIGDRTVRNLLRPYLHDPHPQVRLAALTGLSRLGDPTVHDQAALCLEEADAQVRAAALAIVLADPVSPATVRAQQVWHTMLASSDQKTKIAALSVTPAVPDASVPESVYQALGHADRAVRLEALGVLQQLAAVGRLTRIDAAGLSALADEEMEVRERALQVLAAIRTPEALTAMLGLLDDEQPRVRDALVHAVQPFGRQAIDPLLACLHASQTSFFARETALWALARLEGVPAEALVPFWEHTLRDIYHYKLMLTCLATHDSLAADAFLRVALQNEHDQLLTLVLHLLAVWESSEVAHLVESGLRDPDRYQRANALEALESLGERRFTRLLLPLLEATEEPTATWQTVARQHWHLTLPEVRTVIETCLQATQRWVVIGALLAGHARATPLSAEWRQQLEHYAASATDAQIQETARRLLGYEMAQLHQTLSLTDVMLFLKRVPLYSSLSLEQIYTIAIHLTERDVGSGETIVYEGEHSDEFYLIVTGQVDIVKAYGETTATLATLSAGDFFGEMAIFEQLPRVASVIAIEQNVLLVLSAAHFRRVILQDPSISFGILRELSARLRRL
jgi:HEAT repeat protein